MAYVGVYVCVYTNPAHKLREIALTNFLAHYKLETTSLNLLICNAHFVAVLIAILNFH